MAGPSIPPEIITDIMTRVPAKSIGRFRCVSKPWRSLLSEPQFLKSHFDRSKQVLPESLLISCYRSKLTLSSSLEYAIIPHSHLYCAPLGNRVARQLFNEIPAVATKLSCVARDSSVLTGCDTCDGLILVEDDDEELSNWFLTNPITKETRALPDISVEIKNSIKYAIGYDHVSDDYKVVAFALLYCYIRQFNVYSVRNGTWKGYQRFLPREHGYYVALAESGVPLNARIHWISHNTMKRDSAAAVIGFDMVEEKFCNVPVPSSTCGDSFRHNSRLVVLQGCLGFVSRIGESNKAEVWVMKEYGVEESWTKTIIVEVGRWFSWPLVTMLGGSEWVVKKDSRSYSTKFAIYNLDGGILKDLVLDGLRGDDGGGNYYERALYLRGTFMESLISPYYNYKTPATKKRIQL